MARNQGYVDRKMHKTHGYIDVLWMCDLTTVEFLLFGLNAKSPKAGLTTRVTMSTYSFGTGRTRDLLGIKVEYTADNTQSLTTPTKL